MKKLTCYEYIRIQIDQYPTLYASRHYKTSKIQIMDQLLNVIGNGIRCDEELDEQTNVPDDFVIPTFKNIQKYLVEDVYHGYLEQREIKLSDTKTIYQGEGECIHCVESERKNHPEVAIWLKSTQYPVNIYPNFKQEYSTIYQCPKFLTMDSSWINGAIEFYKFSKEWIINNGDKEYHSGYPGEHIEYTQREFLNAFEKYKSNEEISKAYGHEYDGDLHKFLKTRWDKEKSRIIDFIDSTLKILNKQKAI